MSILINIILLTGLTIFILSNIPQITRLYKGKHTIGMVPISWTLNYVGRLIWVPYAAIAISGTEGLLMLIGQGVITIMNIPMIYYSFRNNKTKGEYSKPDFKRWLFAIRIGLSFLSITVIIIGSLLHEGFINQPNISDIKKLMIGLVATTFTAIAFLPQTIKVWKTRNTKSLSLKTTLLFAVGNTLMLSAMIIKCGVFPEALVGLIGAIILGSISTIMMYITSVIKYSNIKHKGEK